jgi:cytidylate kinase-like protein
MARSVICISRTLAAGGEEIGRAVANRLGFLYVDEEVIAGAAARAGLDVAHIADEEKRRPMFSGLLDHLYDTSGVLIAPVPSWTDGVSAEDVRGLIREAINEIAGRGSVVIVAHAASFAVGPRSQALRVLVTAPQDTRATRLAAADGIGGQEAAKAIRRSDGDRVDYLKRFYGVAEERPTHYDLVVNTDTISVEKATMLITQAAAE